MSHLKGKKKFKICWQLGQKLQARSYQIWHYETNRKWFYFYFVTMTESCLEDIWTWSSLLRKVATGRERPKRVEEGRNGSRKAVTGLERSGRDEKGRDGTRKVVTRDGMKKTVTGRENL